MPTKRFKSKILTRVGPGQASDPTRSGLFESDSDPRPPLMGEEKKREEKNCLSLIFVGGKGGTSGQISQHNENGESDSFFSTLLHNTSHTYLDRKP